MDESTDIRDVIDEHRFLYVEDGIEAQLVYRVNGDRLILVHTEVPEQLGGRGIAGRLVRAAVDRAAVSGETVLPMCPYTQKWLQGHPEEAARIAIDWSEPPPISPRGQLVPRGGRRIWLPAVRQSR